MLAGNQEAEIIGKADIDCGVCFLFGDVFESFLALLRNAVLIITLNPVLVAEIVGVVVRVVDSGQPARNRIRFEFKP